MPRFIILGVVLAVAFTLYTLVDAAMTESRRARGVPKPVWVVICVVLPVIGGILWLTVGKGDGHEPKPAVRPDDDPRFGAMSADNVDQRIADLEQQLRELDDEVYPGEASNTGGGEGRPASGEAGSATESGGRPADGLDGDSDVSGTDPDADGGGRDGADADSTKADPEDGQAR